MQIQSKLPDTGTTIFTVMSTLAAKHNAINLGQGFPDFEMSSVLTEMVNKAMKDGYNQYVPMQGYGPLMDVLAEKNALLYNAKIDGRSQITITPGGTYGIYTALTTILRPGDEVIVFEPAYDSYIPNIIVNGAIPILINLTFPEYKINWEEVKQKISKKTKAIIINSPHNPTGSVLREEDMLQLIAVTKNTNIFIISDEVYEHIIFDDIPHQSVLRYPELIERSFASFSFGKVFHCTGWKLGYTISSPELMAEFRKVHQFNCFSCHSPSQVALASFLQNPEVYLSLSSFLQKKKDHFQKLMKETKFSPLPSYGSYFQCYTYGNISDEPDTVFAERITKEYGVASIPVSVFYKAGTDNKVVRFCFAKKEQTLEKAVVQLQKIK